ncbi:MAG: SPFH domain-containing protein, partial [Terriglobales bacterium]
MAGYVVAIIALSPLLSACITAPSRLTPAKMPVSATAVRTRHRRDGILGVAFVLACVVSSAIQVADQWNKAVVLRLGKSRSLQGPGLFFIIPLIDTIPYWLDIRVLTSSFKAEKNLTKDTVPVDVDAVLFWKMVDPKKAALDVADYKSAISWASQTALRDVIGKTMLSDMLEGKDKISDALQKII